MDENILEIVTTKDLRDKKDNQISPFKNPLNPELVNDIETGPKLKRLKTTSTEATNQPLLTNFFKKSNKINLDMQ